ncbi:MAG: flagellar filament capping protein FliD [Ignavibacteria bacterium]
MDVSTLVNTQLQLGQLAQAGGTSSATSVGKLMAPATQRVERELQSTNVKLSAYGQIKSAFAGAETAAGTLTRTAKSKTATDADVQKAAQAFVAAYNQASQTVAAATDASAKQPGALASEGRARSAGADLSRSLTAGNSLSDLKQAGISLGKNGTLTLDTKAFAQALQSNPSQTKAALASLGQQVNTAADRELASSGNVGTSVNRLSSRAQTLAAQQTALQQQASSLQATLGKQGAALDYVTASGLAAYRNILG